MRSFQFQKLNLDSAAINQIVELRKQAYQKKYQDFVRLSGLGWNDEDASGQHFGAFLNGQLISCLRLTEIKSNAQFERVLRYSENPSFIFTPSLALARAATHVEYLGLGINMALRAFVYRYIKQHLSKDHLYIYGTTLAESKRLQFLKDIDYEVIVHQQKWDSFLSSSDKPIAVFRLKMTNLDKALGKMEATSFAHNHIALKPF